MSLLLDALKRAEQEKLTRQGDRPPEPAPAAPAPPPAAPALELQPLASSGPAPAPGAPRPADAHAAQTLFGAKGVDDSRPNRGALWAIVGAIVVVVLAAGAYVWYSLHSPALRTVATTRIRPLPPPAAPADLAASTKPEPVAIPPMATPSFSSSASMSAPPSSPAAPLPMPMNASAPGAAPNGAAAKEPATAALDRLLESAPETPPPVRLERSIDKARTPPQLAAGYDALVAGDLAGARRHYTAALAADELSVDAHLGMATIDAREGRVSEAAAHYRRALDLDAHNATALAGLAALADNAHPEAIENELRSDLARHPDSAALQTALGNLYASQARWSEAQDAYFEAHRLDPGNADVLFNLAVSLDHLGQAKLAADFYRRALAAARMHQTQFDPAGVARRLAELQR